MTEQELLQLRERLKLENQIDADRRAKEPRFITYDIHGSAESIKDVLRLSNVNLIVRFSQGKARIAVQKGNIGYIKEKVPNIKLVEVSG